MAEVAVVGAGLSGLVAARRLVRSGVERVQVIEARDRVGGRVNRFTTEAGRSVETGGEFIGLHNSALVELADELGLKPAALPSEGSFVRISGGQRLVEAYPLESDPEALQIYTDAVAALDELAAQVPVTDPWNAARAAERDGQTLQTWVDTNVPNAAVRTMLANEYDYCGATFAELSLLYALWIVHAMGGWETWTQGLTHKLAEGSSELALRMAAELGDRITLNTPLRRVEHRNDGVVLHTDGGKLTANALIVALSPNLCARIAWDPALPLLRDRLQGRYLQGHGIKFVAFYERAWWRDEGLLGMGMGLKPISLAFDATTEADESATIVGFTPVTGEIAQRFGEELDDPGIAKRLFVSQLVDYLGAPAGEPDEVCMFNWTGDAWSAGCAAGAPPGVLSTVGHALRAPVGSVTWAGAETGTPQNDWLEAAVSSGERAAREVLARLG
jgi:monoamine oxidase